MKKLGSHAEMKKGHVYNLVYGGSNEKYARINGKRTIRILQAAPIFEYVQLYGRYVSPTSDDLRSDTITVGNLDAAFGEDEIFEPENENEWFKHSAKVTSLTDGIEKGILTHEMILDHPVQSSHSPFVACSSARTFLGLYTAFDVEDQTSQPYLQQVYVWWDRWEEMYADFLQFGVDARR